MSVVGSTVLTLKDKFAQTVNGEITNQIIDLLATTNELLQDAVVVECNEGTHNKTTVRNGLPSAEFRQYYGGVDCQKGDYSQVVDATGMLETYSQADKALVDHSNNPQQFRANEAVGFLEGMNQTILENIFYGSTATNPAAFNGLAKRYNKLASNGDTKSIASRVISAGGSNNKNTSIWLITWGELHTHLIYPQGSKAGLEHQDLGEVTVTTADGKMYQAYRDHYKWDIGLTVRDYRSTIRICNIDVDALAAGTVALDDLMLKAYYKARKYFKTGKPVFYANEEVLLALHKKAKDKANVHLSIDEFEGKPVVKFMNVPIREVEQLVNNEANVA